MAAPLVSIIIPVYNVSSFIRKNIESVIDQTESDWELILVNDGSTDNSGGICDEYARKDTRITVLHQPNSGVSIARNNGMARATGKYICFIDGDDYVNPEYLSSMLNNIDGHDIVYANVTHRYPDEDKIAKAFSYQEGAVIKLRDDASSMIRYQIIENGFPVAKLFKSAIIKDYDIRFNADLSYHEDHIFVLEYLKHCESITLTDNAAYQYIHLTSGTSLSKRKHSAQKLIAAAECLLPLVKYHIDRCGISDRKYRKRLHTILGLNQILLALKNKHTHEISAIGKAVRRHRWQFLTLYHPNHLAARILPFPFLLHLDFIFHTCKRKRQPSRLQ